MTLSGDGSYSRSDFCNLSVSSGRLWGPSGHLSGVHPSDHFSGVHMSGALLLTHLGE